MRARSNVPTSLNYTSISIGQSKCFGWASLTKFLKELDLTTVCAARDLPVNHNRSVLLLEARDRIGGRTVTANELGKEVVMGDTWVH